MWSVFIVAMIIRIIFAKNVQLWKDEVYIFFVSRENGLLDLLLQNHWDTLHPPLYFIFLHYWQKVSINPYILRIPSLIASAFSLWMVVKIAEKYFGKYKYMPIVSMVFFAFSQSQISVNTLVRPYAFVTLAMLISLYYFKDVFENGKHWLLFGITNFVVFFADFSGVWLLVSYLCFALYILLKNKFKNQKRILGLAKSSIVSFSFLIFYLPIFINGLDNALRIEKSVLAEVSTKHSQWGSLWWNLPFFAGVLRGDLLIRLGLVDMKGLGLLIVIVSLFGLIVIGKFAKKYSAFFVLLMVLPIILSLSFSALISPIFLARNLLVVTIPLLLGLSLAVSYLMEKNIFIGLFVLLFVAVNFLQNPLKLQYSDPPIDWRSIARFIHTRSKGNSIISVSEPLHVYEPIRYYYLLDYKEAKLNFRRQDSKVRYLNYDDAFLVNLKTDDGWTDRLEYFFKVNRCGIDEEMSSDYSWVRHCNF